MFPQLRLWPKWLLAASALVILVVAEDGHRCLPLGKPADRSG